MSTGNRTEVDVAVVGAGFAGLGTALRLAGRGRESFVVLERAPEVGGTWRDNVYPGVACDVPAPLYSLSFAPVDHSRVFAPGAEIQEHLRSLGRRDGVRENLRLSTELLRARWDGSAGGVDGRWELETSAGAVRARTLVLAAGRLTEPRFPDVAGLADLAGPVVHTARWPGDLDLRGARVGVVGTGASAVQVVPELARVAAGLVVFQRSAPWIVPRGDGPWRAGERDRQQVFAELEGQIPARRGEAAALRRARERAEQHRARQVRDPGLAARLRPEHEIGCRRVLLSDDYYPALQLPHVRLEPTALRAVTGPRTVVSAAGREHDVDALVLATGFRAARPPYAERVRGERSTLAEHWSARGMTSVASTVVTGFPNLFVLGGPNAGLGHNSALTTIEAQIDYLLGALDHLDADPRPLAVSAAAEDAYTREIDAMAAGTVWLDGCRSWYRDPVSGRLTLVWPGSAAEFRARNGTFDPAPFGRG
ncbi:flavin-containing monooxygenase [Kineococcus gynurae]|uniref:Flavin-containing monooxygenase n=1 Tax=Kineococcus gynurae TaxID=452979 RepID=A0ABV5LWN8_9ACTN